jgi:hypothetical protein
MASSTRPVPTRHRELVAALADGVLPNERDWLDFKRQLPRTPPQEASSATGSPRRTGEGHGQHARGRLSRLGRNDDALIPGGTENKA